MRYAYITIFLIALMMPAEAITQTNTEGNFSIVFSTHPDRLIVNQPVHIELHIQNTETGATIGGLKIEELLVRLREPNEQNISYRELLDMKANPSEPPGHYHANYSFNKTGTYAAVVQFKSNGNSIESFFSFDVKPKEREPLQTEYNLIVVMFVTLAVVGAIAWALRRMSDIFKIK